MNTIPSITKDNLPDNAQQDSGKWEFKDPLPMILSTSDDRTVNNVMRHEYKILDDIQKAQMQKVKDDALAFWELIDSIGSSRELSLAKTKIEESVFWSIKHITG